MDKERAKMIAEIVKRIDHTILAPVTTWKEIEAHLDEAMEYHVASVAIPMSYIKDAADYVKAHGSDLCVQCPIGYPSGYTTTAVKVYEIRDAMCNGATEFDMVINLGWVKDKRWDDILNELKLCKEAANGHILKVIIEAGLLTDEEKIKMCELITEAGCDFIKTATGYNTTWPGYNKGVATVEDVELFKKHLGPNVRIKAAGGMYSMEDADVFVQLGAERLGSKALLGIAREAGYKPGMENE
jgi:deoxyribose-phosphate aldolase